MYRGNRWQLAADYNAWMNARLYAVCAARSDEDRKRDRGASSTPAVSPGADIVASFDDTDVLLMPQLE